MNKWLQELQDGFERGLTLTELREHAASCLIAAISDERQAFLTMAEQVVGELGTKFEKADEEDRFDLLMDYGAALGTARKLLAKMNEHIEEASGADEEAGA